MENRQQYKTPSFLGELLDLGRQLTLLPLLPLAALVGWLEHRAFGRMIERQRECDAVVQRNAEYAALQHQMDPLQMEMSDVYEYEGLRVVRPQGKDGAS